MADELEHTRLAQRIALAFGAKAVVPGETNSATPRCDSRGVGRLLSTDLRGGTTPGSVSAVAIELRHAYAGYLNHPPSHAARRYSWCSPPSTGMATTFSPLADEDFPGGTGTRWAIPWWGRPELK
jgi:hypothetical protein